MINSLGFFVSYVFSAVWPVLGLAFLGYLAWLFWHHYVEHDFISGIDWVLLEIVPPRDVLRSPKAMELFFTNGLYHLSNKGFVEKYWLGAVQLWFSLEIVSIGGQVHFYIRTPSRLKGLIETQLYAQYPQAQVKLAEDYTLAVNNISPESGWDLWGCEFTLAKPDAYPIKTYVDFGLDKDPKEEYKVDPISPVIELFGSIEKGEQVWMQIVIAPSQKKYHTHGTWFGHHGWVEESEHMMKELTEKYTKSKEAGEDGFAQMLPKWVSPVLEGMNTKSTKAGFDTGIRVCYVAKKENFQNNSKRNLRLIFRQYDISTLNSFKRVNTTSFSHFWQFSPSALFKLKERMLLEYRERAFLYPPLIHHIPIPFPVSLFFPKYNHSNISVLNTEELATIFHFPGQILKVPTLERIESKEAAPPTNLPM